MVTPVASSSINHLRFIHLPIYQLPHHQLPIYNLPIYESSIYPFTCCLIIHYQFTIYLFTQVSSSITHLRFTHLPIYQWSHNPLPIYDSPVYHSTYFGGGGGLAVDSTYGVYDLQRGNVLSSMWCSVALFESRTARTKIRSKALAHPS